MVKKKRTKKAKRSPRQKMLIELDLLWPKVIKYRDKWTCQWTGCGKVHATNDRSCHASHIKPRSKGHWARFELSNGKALCHYHHMGVWHKDPIAADKFIKVYAANVGLDLDWLTRNAEQTIKYTNDDLQEMIWEMEKLLEQYKTEYDG